MAQFRWRLAGSRRLEAQPIQDMVARRGSDDADAMMVAAFRNDTTTATALNTLQRYAAAIQRAAFRARQQLLELRKTEVRDARDAARQNEPNSAVSPHAPTGRNTTAISALRNEPNSALSPDASTGRHTTALPALPNEPNSAGTACDNGGCSPPHQTTTTTIPPPRPGWPL